jgi:UDP-N-acetylglucosamine acyltransferase
MRIDATARIDKGARIEPGAVIGPYCIVGADVSIGADCHLIAHVHVEGRTTIGPRTVVHPYARLGGPPQSLAYAGEPTSLTIGADCTIRESVTMNRGTAQGGGETVVGDAGLFMAYCHIAHDCRIGHHAVFANAATLGGHCVLGDHVMMSGLVAAHQFTRIGSGAMASGVSAVRGDIIPFGLAAGAQARLVGINVVGMRRRQFPAATIRAVRTAYRLIFTGLGSLTERIARAEAELGHDPAVAEIIAFLRAPRKRPLCQPRGRGRSREEAAVFE